MGKISERNVSIESRLSELRTEVQPYVTKFLENVGVDIRQFLERYQLPTGECSERYSQVYLLDTSLRTTALIFIYLKNNARSKDSQDYLCVVYDSILPFSSRENTKLMNSRLAKRIKNDDKTTETITEYCKLNDSNIGVRIIAHSPNHRHAEEWKDLAAHMRRADSMVAEYVARQHHAISLIGHKVH